MAHQVFFQQLTFQRTDPDDPQVPVGKPEIVKRGGMVPDYVLPFTIGALLNAGMIVPVADQPDARIVPFDAIPQQPRTLDQPPILPSDPQGLPPTQADAAGETATPEPEAAPVERPEVRDNKAAWEDYAVQIGVPRGEAEGMTKANLIAEVERRETPVAGDTPVA